MDACYNKTNLEIRLSKRNQSQKMANYDSIYMKFIQ